MLSFPSPREAFETEASNVMNTEQPIVLACDFREVREVIEVRIVDGRSVSVCTSSLVELFGLITFGMRGIGQVATLPAARAEVRLTRVFGSGTIRQKCRQERNVGVTVRRKQGRRMKRENGESEMERYDMRTANTLSHACTRCLYATQVSENIRAWTPHKCQKMCVRHGVCARITIMSNLKK